MTRRFILLLLLTASLWAQRDVVSLSSPLTETAYLLGQQDRLAIVSDSSVFPEQVVADRTAVTSRRSPSVDPTWPRSKPRTRA